MAAATASTFWTRMRISETERLGALEAIRSRYGGYCVQEHEEQGLCSYTLLLTPVRTSPLLSSREQRIASPCPPLSRRHNDADSRVGQLVVQLRGPAHLLDLDLAETACRIYHPLAPRIRLVDNIPLLGGLVAYEMNCVEGTPLSRVLQRRWETVRDEQWESSMEEEEKMIVLVRSFAHMLAKPWPPQSSPRRRRDSVIQPHPPPPPHKNTDMLSLCTGKVGSQIAPKLSKLAQQLPDSWLRARAQSTLDQVRKVAVREWPVVLTHGDLIPSNILVDCKSGAVSGLVDWAEAEELPFGMGLYGIEEVLGCLEQVPVPVSEAEAEAEAGVMDGREREKGIWRFVYADGADRYRTLFLRRLLELVPQTRGREEVLWAMRDLGVLLWHGFAWDGGKIDRVVNEVDDGEELAKLRAMLVVRLDIRDNGSGNE
ncbi:hypothetical protein E8E13_000763 [Curvularia kusanoi]|uniref:Aminoglycoside phosphotransferase domain-containing protein n=1 Tax=Curvularia kusanoi TaxID=90978 RepID=A0A9P4T5H2_CURKU|nr:hypothetical protein E8E13_000763 [Curvularia kusanoi]